MNTEHDIETLFKQSRLPAVPPELKARVLSACRPNVQPTRIIPLFAKYALAASWVAAVLLQVVASRQESAVSSTGCPSPTIAAAVVADPDMPEELAQRSRLAAVLMAEPASPAENGTRMIELIKGERFML